jgi:hypothetical protein
MPRHFALKLWDVFRAEICIEYEIDQYSLPCVICYKRIVDHTVAKCFTAAFPGTKKTRRLKVDHCEKQQFPQAAVSNTCVAERSQTKSKVNFLR